MALRVRGNIALVLALVAGGGQACTCSKAGGSAPDASSSDAVAAQGDARVAGDASSPLAGLSAPVAASHVEHGDVVVAGLDVAARAVHVQRISDKDQVVADRTIFEGATWSTEAAVEVVPAAGGVAVTWSGRRGGKLVRQMLILGPDLAPLAVNGQPIDVAASSCATEDALWFTTGARVHARDWSGRAQRFDLPRNEEASLACGAHRAFALLDGDEGTSLLVLGATSPDGGRPRDAGSRPGAPIALLTESDFGDDEERERSEYTAGDDLGVVRLSASGAIALREIRSGVVEPVRRLKTTIPRDDDVVAVDASPRAAVIVFTEDASDSCAAEGGASPTMASTRVKALRVDRATLEETVVDLAPGTCGREIGPFFTSGVGDDVSVAWVERVAVAGKARAPITGLVHRAVRASGPPGELSRAEQPADALVDAGCDRARCYAVALARQPGMDGMVPGLARVLRY